MNFIHRVRIPYELASTAMAETLMITGTLFPKNGLRANSFNVGRMFIMNLTEICNRGGGFMGNFSEKYMSLSGIVGHHHTRGFENFGRQDTGFEYHNVWLLCAERPASKTLRIPQYVPFVFSQLINHTKTTIQPHHSLLLDHLPIETHRIVHILSFVCLLV